MKRKLALLCCAAVLAAMISACGGSSASASSEAQPKEEPAAQETATEAVIEEDEAEAVDAVEESADAAATQASAEKTAEAAAETAASEDALEATIDYVQKSRAISEIDFASLPELDESKKLNVTEVSEDNPELIEGAASKALFKYYKKHGYTITQKTEMLMANFLANGRFQIGGKGKAMVVADSRASKTRIRTQCF